MRDKIDKIKNHFGPMASPGAFFSSLIPSKNAKAFVYDLEVIFDDFTTCPQSKRDKYVEALNLALREIWLDYLQRLEDEKPDLYDTLTICFGKGFEQRKFGAA